MDVDAQVVADAIAAEARSLRARHRLTQQAAADRLGWTRTRVADVDLGRRTLSVADLFRLADCYDVPVSTFTDAIAEALQD